MNCQTCGRPEATIEDRDEYQHAGGYGTGKLPWQLKSGLCWRTVLKEWHQSKDDAKMECLEVALDVERMALTILRSCYSVHLTLQAREKSGSKPPKDMLNPKELIDGISDEQAVHLETELEGLDDLIHKTRKARRKQVAEGHPLDTEPIAWGE